MNAVQADESLTQFQKGEISPCGVATLEGYPRAPPVVKQRRMEAVASRICEHCCMLARRDCALSSAPEVGVWLVLVFGIGMSSFQG